MIKCTGCGYENPDYCIFCRKCGSALSSLNSVGQPSAKEEQAPRPVEVRKEEPAYVDPKQIDHPNVPKEVVSPDNGKYKYTGPVVTNIPNNDNAKDIFCVLGFAASILSVFCLGITSIVGIILSLVGLHTSRKQGTKGASLAVIGIIISVLTIAMMIIILIATKGEIFKGLLGI